jgi:transmembrane sensor
MLLKMNNMDDLIIRFLTGIATKDESSALIKWIKNSRGNKEYFNKLRDIWLASSQIKIKEPFSVRNINSATDQSVDSVYQVKTSHSFRLFREFAKIAAVFIFALITGALGYRIFYDKPDNLTAKQNPVTIESKRGAMSLITLPDGSKAWLNAGSEIVYGDMFNISTREVKLFGEAYFEVVKNPSKPFIVKAGDIAIKALGTSFNVKAYPEDRSVVTTLVNGQVVIEGKDNKNKEFTVNLKPNQTVTYFIDQQDYIAHLDDNKAVITDRKESGSIHQTEMKDLSIIKMEQIKPELFTSWKDKNWIIEQQSLANLCRELERRYAITIEISSENIKKYRFSGIIQNETIEQILYILHNTMPLKYTMEKGRVIIEEDKNMIKEFR